MPWRATIRTRHWPDPTIEDLTRLRVALSDHSAVLSPDVQRAEGPYLSSSFELDCDQRRVPGEAGAAFVEALETAGIEVPANAVENAPNIRRARFETFTIEWVS